MLLEYKQNKFDNIVDGAFSKLSRVARAWLNPDNDMRRNIQQTVFPDGLVYKVKKNFERPQLSWCSTL